MKKIKWGILGTAKIAGYGMIPGMKLASNCELYAIAGRNPEKVMDYKTKYGFEKAYNSYDDLIADNEVQAVYIPLPNHLHLEWVTKALKAGKHVLCEKPLALNAEQAKQMFNTARDCNRIFMEAYAYLHSPYVKSIQNDIKNGLIGKIDYVDTAFITQGYKEDFRLHKEFGGGAMYDLGCYCTTMILSVIESEPEQIKAVADFTELGVDYLTSAIIKFKNGARAAFNAGMVLGENSNSRYDRLFIHGTKGSIKSDVEYNQEGEVKYLITTADGVLERKITVPQNYSLEVEQLGRCILDGEKPYITQEFSIKNAQLIDSVLKETGF